MKEALRQSLVPIICLFLAGAVGATVKLTNFGLTDSSDYQEYIGTAKYINGEDGARKVPHRLLKPLAPLAIAALAHIFEYQTAVLVLSLIGYAALALAMYLLAHEFLDDRYLATLTTLLVILSYPVVKYGIEINIETGALFFYVFSLYLTVRFLKTPTWKLLLFNALVVAMGFLWKEYSIVSAIAFGLTILLHPVLSLKEKIRFVSGYATLFLAIHIPLQAYVYLVYDYTYLSWYMGNAPAAVEQGEFTLKTIIKSTAALLGIAWLLVPIGLMRWNSYDLWQKRFFQSALLPPFLGYVWGYISSRLLYVMAPPFLLVAALGMRTWSRPAQTSIVALAIIANMGWLFLSYRIVL